MTKAHIAGLGFPLTLVACQGSLDATPEPESQMLVSSALDAGPDEPEREGEDAGSDEQVDPEPVAQGDPPPVPEFRTHKAGSCTEHGRLTAFRDDEPQAILEEEVWGVLVDDAGVSPETLLSVVAWGKPSYSGLNLCRQAVSSGAAERCDFENTAPWSPLLPLLAYPIDGGLFVPCRYETDIVVRYQVSP